jgi:hypothetical protein
MMRRGDGHPPISVVAERSPERARLRDCIAAHTNTAREAARVEEARERTYARLFDELHPAVRTAQQALLVAKANAPRALVDAALGDGEDRYDGPTVKEAEASLRDAETNLADGRSAREVLSDQATKAAIRVGEAERHVTAAVQAVVSASTARASLLAEYWRCANRALRCAQALRTSGVVMQGAESHGLRFVISEAAAAVGEHPFRHDAEWLAALAALREDADARLPELPAADADD